MYEKKSYMIKEKWLKEIYSYDIKNSFYVIHYQYNKIK